MSIEFTQPGYIYVWKQTPEGDIYVSRHVKQEEATESVFRHVEANGDGDYRIETPDRFVKVKYVVFKRPATEPPSAPTGLVILSLDAGTAVLDWNNNPEPNVTAYRVYYSQNGISFELYSSPSLSTAAVTGLAPAITHFFKVSAFNSAGQESAFSSTVSGADTVPPAIPTGLLVVPGSITGNQLALDWNNNTDTDFAYYRVYQSTNQSTWTNISGDITNSVHVATGLISETTYYFRVAATDTSGNESAPTSSVSGTTLDVTAPANATNFAILESSTTASTMFMTWTASVSSDIAGYKIYRSTDDTNYTLRATLGLVTNYEDTGLTANTLYYYKISAIDEVPNESALSAADSYTTLTSGLTWINDSVPFPLSIQAGGSHDLEQYITDIAQLGNIESIGTALPSGVTIESTPTWHLAATSGATLGTTSGHQLRLVRSADYDWQQRISGSGVVWYHNFESETEVTKFVKTAELPKVTWSPTNGVGFGGCVVCSTGTSAGGNGWMRPFSALPGDPGYISGDPDFSAPVNISNWPRGYYGHPDYWSELSGGFKGHEFWLSVAMWVDPNRWHPDVIDGGKTLWLTQVETTPNCEVVVSARRTGPMTAYTNFGSPQLKIPQFASTGYAHQPGGDWNDTCTYSSFNTASCWSFPGVFGLSEWNHFLIHGKLGHAGVADSTVEISVAIGGVWHKIIASDVFTFTYGSRPKGWNAFQGSAYYNNDAVTVPFSHKYAQVIFSTAEIPPPQV